MPRGKKSKPPAWTFEMKVPTGGIDFLIRKADQDELASAICEPFNDGVKTDILAYVFQHRVDSLIYPPDKLLTELGERIQSFAPQPMENPDNAETGIKPA
jgi:hypothetical protein